MHNLVSILLPTYNRLPILKKCINSLLNQNFSNYEILVVDDGSTDGTKETISDLVKKESKIRYIWKENEGISKTRNLCVKESRGEYLIFVDSDAIVSSDFIKSHMLIHQKYKYPVLSQGKVIITYDFENPFNVRFNPLTDCSRAIFDTCNVSVAKEFIIKAGMFDENFYNYGWEDLELGFRLRKLGLKVIRNNKAICYHYQPPFDIKNINLMIEKEKSRGKGAVYFLKKHPCLEVRLMTQITHFHYFLDWIITLGGRMNENHYLKILRWLDKRGYKKTMLAILRVILNHYNIQEIKNNF